MLSKLSLLLALSFFFAFTTVAFAGRVHSEILPRIARPPI
jgi:hypothetical protein